MMSPTSVWIIQYDNISFIKIILESFYCGIYTMVHSSQMYRHISSLTYKICFIIKQCIGKVYLIVHDR